MSNMASDAKVSFSSKVEYRAVIWYLYLKGKIGQEIHCELTNAYSLLHHRMHKLNSGLGNSNAVERL